MTEQVFPLSVFFLTVVGPYHREVVQWLALVFAVKNGRSEPDNAIARPEIGDVLNLASYGFQTLKKLGVGIAYLVPPIRYGSVWRNEKRVGAFRKQVHDFVHIALFVSFD
jgi:hypothetical protein